MISYNTSPLRRPGLAMNSTGLAVNSPGLALRGPSLAINRACRLTLAICLFLTQAAKAQKQTLADSIAHIAASIDGRLGVAVVNGDDHSTVLFHGHDHFPMMSVFKFPIALYILHQVDQRKLTLAAVVPVHDANWHLYSPLLAKYAKYKEENLELGLGELLDSMITESDNAACDLLLKVIGGPSVVNDYIHSLGIDEINIACTETQMAADPKKVYENWCTPAAMNTLLQKFYEGHILSTPSSALLIHLMTVTTTGAHRLKGNLDFGLANIVVHKTGTSDTDANGLTAATNDVGIITLLSGASLYVSVFLADSHAPVAAREHAIALVGRIANDCNTYVRIR
jgi:beta-lactamase class A